MDWIPAVHRRNVKEKGEDNGLKAFTFSWLFKFIGFF